MRAIRKLLSLIIALTFASSILVAALNIPLVRAYSSAYILPDGEILPPTAPIVTFGNTTYTLTGNINGSIYVGRENIVIDGQGHTVTAGSLEYGISIQGEPEPFFGTPVLRVNNVTIKNTTITGCAIGIYISDSSNSIISRNNITSNYRGIELCSYSNCTFVSENNITENTAYGIHVQDSGYNTIVGNTVENNGNGIVLHGSTCDSILGNNVASNNGSGILLALSSNETLSGNIMVDNLRNFGVQGLFPHIINCVDSSNTVNGKSIYYLINAHDQSVPAEAGYVALVNCSRMRVENLDLTHNAQGIVLDYSRDCTVLKNRISNNQCGILLNEGCTNNTLSNNVITNNSQEGILVSWFSINNFLYENNLTNNAKGILLITSSNNAIYENNVEESTSYGIALTSGSFDNEVVHNNFINNTGQVTNDGSLSYPTSWDDGYPSGGNYWSDYNGTDNLHGPFQNETGSDGIGDTPYVIDANNADHFPLVTPHVHLSGDLNGDCSVDNQDAIVLAHAFGSQTGENNWNPAADINLNGSVDIFDAIILASHFGQHLL